MGGLGDASYDAQGYNKAETVTDTELLNLAKAGADKFCTHCDAGNRGDAQTCVKCGASFYGIAAEDHPEAPGDRLHHESLDARMEREQAPAPERATKHYGQKKSVVIQTPPNEEYTPPPPRSTTLPAVGLGITGITGVIGMGMALNWAFTTHDVTGGVSAMTWTREVSIERWTDTTTHLWEQQTSEQVEILPTNGTGERAGLTLLPSTCQSEHFSDEQYVDHYKTVDDPVYKTVTTTTACTKSKPVKDGETCKSNKNGFAHCTDKYKTIQVPDTCSSSKQVLDHTDHHQEPVYASRPIMKPKCDYATQVWTPIGDHPTSGTGQEFIWAPVDIGSLDRALYSATYTVTSSYIDEGQTHDLVNTAVSKSTKVEAEGAASEYLTWNMGTPVYFKINNMGGVSSTSRTKVP